MNNVYQQIVTFLLYFSYKIMLNTCIKKYWIQLTKHVKFSLDVKSFKFIKSSQP